MRNRMQAGNAVIFILLGVALFGALAYTFMKGAKSGQGNLTTQQARLRASEFIDFIKSVERGVDRLRSRGCSENDINFASSNDTGWFIGANTSATAPTDHSCDVFHSAGANVPFTIKLSDLQVPASQISGGEAGQVGNIIFRTTDTALVNLGTTAYEWTIQFNFLIPEVCEQINKILQNNVDLTVMEVGSPLGDENTTLLNQDAFCQRRPGTLQNGGPMHQFVYMLIAR